MKSHRRDIMSKQKDRFYGGGILTKPRKATFNNSNRDSVFEKLILKTLKIGKKATPIINTL